MLMKGLRFVNGEETKNPQGHLEHFQTKYYGVDIAFAESASVLFSCLAAYRYRTCLFFF